MKFTLVIFVMLFVISCFDNSEKTESKAMLEEANEISNEAITSAQKASNSENVDLPKLSDYPRACPEAWGMVKGASQSKVEGFIQNYFHVPDNPTPMYSEVNNYSAANGAVLIKAGTYKMQDNIVDQEMVVMIVAGQMTQCGARLRCASNPTEWVESCDQ